MYIQKYDGNIHPDEWINDIQIYFELKKINVNCLYIAISFIDPIISIPAKVDSLEKLYNALKEDISFTLFKCTNKRLLQSLKYIPEREGGNTSKFISNFRKLCYNSEINDIEEQKNYFCNSLPNNDDNNRYNYFLKFFKRKEKINSMNDLVKEFAEIVTDELNLIRNESIVTLRHVATGKYLSSIENLLYTTGSESQVVFVGSSGPNALWKIKFDKEFDTLIELQHIKSGKTLGLADSRFDDLYCCYKSPITKHTEVSCKEKGNNWKVNLSKLDQQGYLKSNDVINLSIKKFFDNSGNKIREIRGGQDEFLRSHDVQFNIGNGTFQEIVCHNERLGENDEWCIELIKQG